MRRKQILFFSPRLPQSDANAGDLRLLRMLEMMTKEADITFCPVDLLGISEADRKYAAELENLKIPVVIYHSANAPYVLSLKKYDAIFFEFWHCAKPLIDLCRTLQASAKLIIDTVDIHYLREQMAVDLHLLDKEIAAANKKQELETYQRVDGLICITTDDLKSLKDEGVNKPQFYTVPIIMPTRERPLAVRKKSVLFIGGFHHAPNLDAVKWFANEVWPLILASTPDAMYTIVGSNAPAEVVELGGSNNIKFAGFVPDTAIYLDSCWVSVAPLRFGAGMKGKVSEAMACGVPVITTNIGAQGLGLTHCENVLIADSAEEFAAAVSLCLGDAALAEKIGLSGQQHIEAICGSKSVAAAVSAMISSIDIQNERISTRIARIVNRTKFGTRRLLRSLKRMLRQ